jgi:hypothetical protein
MFFQDVYVNDIMFQHFWVQNCQEVLKGPTQIFSEKFSKRVGGPKNTVFYAYLKPLKSRKTHSQKKIVGQNVYKQHLKRENSIFCYFWQKLWCDVY